MKKLQIYRLVLAIIFFLASILSFLTVRNTVETNWKITYLIFGIVLGILALIVWYFFLREFRRGFTWDHKEKETVIANDAKKAYYYPTLDITTRGGFNFNGGNTYPDKGQIIHIHDEYGGLPLYSGFIGHTAKEVADMSDLDFQNMLHTLGIKKK